MEITLKFGNETTTYNTKEEAERFLNEADYYCERLELLYSFEDSVVYDKNTDIEELQKEANIYGEGFLTVFQIFE